MWKGSIIMIEGKILSYGDSLDDVFAIRKKVFVEELGVPSEVVFDQLDSEAMHVLVYEEPVKSNNRIDNNSKDLKKAVATGRITLDGKVCKISNIAVLEEYRNKKYGDFTVRMLINKAFTAGVNEVIVKAFPNVIEFFQKIGFQLIDNENKEYESSDYNMIISMMNVVTKCKK